MDAVEVAAFGTMNTFGDGPSLGVSVCLEAELEAEGALVDSLATGFVDLVVRAMALVDARRSTVDMGDGSVGSFRSVCQKNQ